MGSLLSGLGSCVGSACGGCLAVGCCKLAGSGNVSSAQAARCVLFWLQLFTALLAWLASATPGRWLPWSCDKLNDINLGDVGVCKCRGQDDENDCWSDQLVYRAEFAGFVVFAGLFLMASSGCAEGAAKSHSVAKFMVLILLGIVELFLPNSVFNTFGTAATALSAVFLVVQAVLLIDFAYSWNEKWFGNALEAQRRGVNSRAYQGWLAAVLVSAAILFLGSVAGCVYLYAKTSDTAGRVVDLVALVVAILLLVVSILDWCEHGALLTSTVVMAYVIWLVSETLTLLPDGSEVRSPKWFGLLVCAGSLLSAAVGSGSLAMSPEARPADGAAAPTPAQPAQHSAGAALVDAEVGAGSGARAGSGAEASVAQPSSRGGDDLRGFAVQCAVHAAAAVYVAASMAPRASKGTFAVHAVAVFLCLALYGWSLVAPKVLTGRNFGS